MLHLRPLSLIISAERGARRVAESNRFQRFRFDIFMCLQGPRDPHPLQDITVPKSPSHLIGGKRKGMRSYTAIEAAASCQAGQGGTRRHLNNFYRHGGGHDTPHYTRIVSSSMDRSIFDMKGSWQIGEKHYVMKGRYDSLPPKVERWRNDVCTCKLVSAGQVSPDVFRFDYRGGVPTLWRNARSEKNKTHIKTRSTI